jgi:site-specific recombinase XerD
MTDYFTLLFNTGCRSSEPLKITNWSINGAGQIVLQPFKGNNQRIFDISEIPSRFITAIQDQKPYFDFYSVAKFRYVFNKYATKTQIYVENKSMDMYIFRYNKVKQLRQAGLTKAEIQTFFGWTNSGIVDEYLNADLYTL